MPRTSYLVCATPRSGSTLLCELLGRTGVAGRPQEVFQLLPVTGRSRHPRDYLGELWGAELAAIVQDPPPEHVERTQVEALGCHDFGEYLGSVLASGTTPNGVYGGKVMWGYLEGLAWHLAASGVASTGDVAARLRAAFPDLRMVHVTRRDKLRQAISLWRAMQTWTWRDGHHGRADVVPAYHEGAVAHLVALLEAEDAAWPPFLAQHRFSATTVVYEDLARQPDETVRDVLRFLGLPDAVDRGHPLPLRRQADGTTEEWVARFREARAARQPVADER